MALITVQDLALGYDSRMIVEGLNFSVNAGDYLCVVQSCARRMVKQAHPRVNRQD